MDNQKSGDYKDPWASRTPELLVRGVTGSERYRRRDGKSLFSDFIPYMSVHNVFAEGTPGGVVFETSRVIFEGVNETSKETAQILKTFKPTINGKDFHVSFLGKDPQIFTFSGSLFHMDTVGKSVTQAYTGEVTTTPDGEVDSNWYDSFKYAYENVLRGSKCAELGLQVRLDYDYRWSQGYLLNFNSNFSAMALGVIPFSLSMLISSSGIYHKEADMSAKELISKIAK
jgi:hypothetical protein